MHFHFTDRDSADYQTAKTKTKVRLEGKNLYVSIAYIIATNVGSSCPWRWRTAGTNSQLDHSQYVLYNDSGDINLNSKQTVGIANWPGN